MAWLTIVSQARAALGALGMYGDWTEAGHSLVFLKSHYTSKTVGHQNPHGQARDRESWISDPEVIALSTEKGRVYSFVGLQSVLQGLRLQFVPARYLARNSEGATLRLRRARLATVILIMVVIASAPEDKDVPAPLLRWKSPSGIRL